MSGHSKWDTIKRKKGANDAARAKEFTKVGRMITVAAQNGGGDISMNPALALAVSKAKAINMPNDNIDRAIKKGTGEGGDSSRLEEISYEAYAPNNIALIIDCTTDNKNRSVGEVRSTVEKNGGVFATSGAISWQFKTLGSILLEFGENSADQKWNKTETHRNITKNETDEFQLEIMDLIGLIDIIVDEYGIEIKCEYTELNNIRKFIDSKGLKISEAGLVKVSDSKIELSDADREKVEQFIEKLEDLDDVQRVWSNMG
jgi:YebC/PmpR family DNA-binding regulatory protein